MLIRINGIHAGKGQQKGRINRPFFIFTPPGRENNQRLRKTMRPLLRSYGVSSTVTLSPVRMRM
ncbi:hypothetical protein CKO_02189 [Citrobacter koseri ATCC BAA-895]|uniref:Uncharacterized protein n=1 Tax=Citrobacter koseri (strain ATCC BAA-895 / CDC 4225-83 / SGSC4696) TaxID=290338 RepID=A8AIK0_CITK8|nr:hypothetical protein CKO_02189 [Citrobacter koseri ATCC BAA-895]